MCSRSTLKNGVVSLKTQRIRISYKTNPLSHLIQQFVQENKVEIEMVKYKDEKFEDDQIRIDWLHFHETRAKFTVEVFVSHSDSQNPTRDE